MGFFFYLFFSLVNHWEKDEEYERKNQKSVRYGGKLKPEDGAHMENNLICECTTVQYFCLGHVQTLTDTTAGHTQKFFNCLLYKT